jgi:uncharacterized protein (UPF0548 family)
VIRLRRPSRDEIDAELRAADRPLSYSEVGATADRSSFEALAADYDLGRHRVLLGRGRDLFAQARASLLAWRHFDIAWLELHGAVAPPIAGRVVATLTRGAGLWFLNACRVVYVEGAADPAHEAAFAYGTLPGHVVHGEERFSVRFDPVTDEVTYQIAAFSRPAALFARLGRPWVRRVQQRFVLSSAAALARACRAARGSTTVERGGVE